MPPNNSDQTTIQMLQDLTLRLNRLESSSGLGNSSIRSGALQILDANGRVAASYGFQADGTVGLVSYNPASGAKVIAVGTQADGSQGLAMFDTLGRKVLQIGQQADGTYSLVFDNPSTGTPVVQVGPQADGTNGLTLFDNSGVTQVRIGQQGTAGLYGLEVLNAASGAMQFVGGTSSASSTAIVTTSSTTIAAVPGGPSVTVVIGQSGQAQVCINALLSSGGDGDQGVVVLVIDGNVAGPTYAEGLEVISGGVGIAIQASVSQTLVVTGLTPGSHVFSLGYACSTGVHGTTVEHMSITVSAF